MVMQMKKARERDILKVLAVLSWFTMGFHPGGKESMKSSAEVVDVAAVDVVVVAETAPVFTESSASAVGMDVEEVDCGQSYERNISKVMVDR